MADLQIVYVEIEDLKPHPNNPRINDKAAEKLSKLIAEYGFRSPIVATPDGIIRKGHTTLKAAKILKLTKVPVVYTEFESEEKAQAYMISDNRASDWSEWDIPKLKDMISDIDGQGFDIEFTGFKQTELDSVFGETQSRLMECPNCQCKFNKSRNIIEIAQ